MRKQTIVRIEDFTYELTSLGGEDGVVLGFRLLKLLGKAGPMLAKGKMDEEAFAALGDLLERVQPSELQPFWTAFRKSTWVKSKDGKERFLVDDVFDEHFAGDGIFAAYAFLIESVKFNFTSFLSKGLVMASAKIGTDPTSSP